MTFNFRNCFPAGILLLDLRTVLFMDVSNYNIVIADDDADDHFFLEEAMRSAGIRSNLISVYNGSQLLDLLFTRGNYANQSFKKPDLVLLDLNMPVLDGFTALQQIKRDSYLKNIPVYIFTTSRREADRKMCINLGADDFYSKPSEFTVLQKVVQEMMTKAFNGTKS